MLCTRDDGSTPQKEDFCCGPREEFKELTQAAHDSMMCRVDHMEEQLRDVKTDVEVREVKTNCESTKREVDAHITRMLKEQKEMKEYRITEYDSMRRELDDQTTRMCNELKDQREAIERQEQQTHDMTKQEQRVKATLEVH